MPDEIDSLLEETRKRLGRQDIFNAPPGDIADDHIAQLRKRLVGEVEPAEIVKPSKEPPKPERRVTFPEFAGALVGEMGAGFFKGLTAPVSSFINLDAPITPNDVGRQRTIYSYMRRADVQGLLKPDTAETAASLLSEGTSKVGEVAGTITSFVPVLRATKLGLAGIKAADKAAFPHVARGGHRLAELAAENVGSTTLFEAAMELEDGEDRLSRIVFDSALGATTEAGGAAIRILRQGVRNELGDKAYRALTDAVPEHTVTKVRAGVATPEEAEAVLNVAKNNPSVAQTATGAPTTVVAQARKIQEAVWDKILPPPGGYVVDPQMALDLQIPGKRPGVYYKISVDGQIVDDHIPTGKTQEDAARFGKKLIAVKQRVNQLVSEGKDVRVVEVRAGDTRALNRFKNFFLGKTSARRVTGDHRVPKVPNSVGPESAAVTGAPEPGAHVRAKTDENIFEEVEVVENPNPVISDETFSPDEAAGTRARELRLFGESDPQEAPVPPSKGRQSKATVWVKGRDGKVRPKDLRDITVAVPFRSELKLNNHESGDESRFLIHLGEKRTEFESIAAPLDADSNFFRSEFFNEIDASGDYHESVRGAYRDGQLTLSAPMVYDERIPTMTGPALRDSIPGEGANVSLHYRERRPGPHFIGTPAPGDIEHTLLGRVAPTYEGRYVPGVGMVDNRYKPLRDALPPLERGAIPAGYDPISDLNPPTVRHRQRVVGEAQGFDEDSTLDDLAGDFDAADESAFAPAQLRVLARRGLSPEDVGSGLGEPGLVPVSAVLNKATGPDNPAFVSLQKAAKVLRDQGVSGATPVNLHASNVRYDTGSVGDETWSLDEIIDTELPFPVWSHMQENADVRGLKVRPNGKGAIVSTMDGTEYKFDTQMEAYEAVGRIPVNKVGPKLEAEIEKALGFGSERTFDADVDVDTFRPRRIQSLAVSELVQGGRPAVSVLSRNESAIKAAISAVEKQAGLQPGTFKVQTVAGGDHPRKAIVVYDPNRVRQAIAPVAGFLEQFLGIAKPMEIAPELLVQKLAKLPQGTAIIAGRDVHSAVMYTWLRKKGMKEEWKGGVMQADALGPFRVFPQAKGFVGALQGQQPGQRPQIMAMATDVPDANGKDLADILSLPPGMGAAFTPPPKPVVPEISDEGMTEFAEFVARQRAGRSVINDQGGGIGQQLWSWLAVPRQHWQKRQVDTGVPYFDWWESISMARRNVEVSMNDMLAQNRTLSKQYSRDVRIQGQQLFESKMHKVGYEQMLENADESVKRYADQQEQMLRTFFKDEIGLPDEQFEFFWGDEVSNIRKNDGDYAAYLSRNPVPGPSRTIINQIKTGEVYFDQREYDGSLIAKRVARAFAHEKHLVPAHKEVAATLTAYVNAGRMPQPDYAMFVRYMHEALHRPDDVQLSLSYGIKKTVDAIVGKFPGAKKYLSEADSVNVVDAYSAVNTLSNMGFQPGMVMRNFIGGAQMIYMRQSASHATSALGWAAGALKDPAKRKWLEHRGVIMRDPVSQSVAQIGEAVRQMEGGRVLGPVGTGFSKMLEHGMGAYKTADDMTRVWAYKTQYEVSKELSEKLSKGEITIEGFIDRAQVDMLGPIVERNTRSYLEKGMYEEAAHYTATHFKDMTQFQYERGNTPRILQSTLGRLFGQYGTWPLSYIDTMKNLVTGPGSRKNRYTALTKWAAIHTATFQTMSLAFGVDFTRWSYLAPMGFKGGPFLELADQSTEVLKAKVSGEDDAVSRIEAARLQNNVVKQLTPLPWGAIRTAGRTYEEAVNQDWPSMMRALLGMPEQK